MWAEDVVSKGDEEGEVGECALADACGEGSGGEVGEVGGQARRSATC